MSLIDRVALALLAGVFLTMPVFAAVSRSRPLDPEVVKRSKTVLIGRWMRNWVIWAVGPLERAGVNGRTHPDVFSWAGVFLAALAGLAFALGQLSVAAWLVLLSGATDIVDGRIARARGIESRYGAFLDAVLDRYCDCLVFLGLVWYFAAMPWALIASVLALAGSLLVSYMRAEGEALGVDCDLGLMQRAERLVPVAIAAILDHPVASWSGVRPGTLTAIAVVAVAIGSVGTAVYRMVWISRVLRARAITAERSDSCSVPRESAISDL